jgi:hypothetical protein
LSFDTKDGQCRIQTPTISAFEAEFETCLITIKKGLEPLWKDRRPILKPGDSSGLFKLYSDSMFIFSYFRDLTRNEVITFIQASFEKAITSYRNELLKHVQKIGIGAAASLSNSSMSQFILGIDKSIVIGRAARAIGLKIKEHANIFQINPTKGGSQYDIQDNILEIYVEAHRIWIKSMGERLKTGLGEQLKNYDWNFIDLYKSLWEG